MSSSTYGDRSHDDTSRSRSGIAGRDLARTAAGVVGAVFLLVGVLGFIPGITQDYDLMEFAGHESGAELLGIFQVSVLHNIVHLLFGLAGLAAARRSDWSIGYLIGGGVIYLLLAVYGFVIEKAEDANFVPVNSADDWLHVALGVAMVGLGLAAKAARDRDTSTRARRA
jgi:hypothetical protein